MALQLNKELETGAVVNYFNIQRLDWYPIDKVADVTLNGYISAEARREGKRPAFTITFRMEVLMDKDPTRVDIYNIVKDHPDFRGSIDV